MSNRDQPDIGPTYWTNFFVKKFAHLFIYAVLGVLAFRVFRSWKKSLIFTVIYAITDEIHQSFIPGREPKVLDVIIDAVGGGLGLWIIRYIPPTVRKRLAI